MAATIVTLSAILKEFYAGPIAEQLNQEILVYELFEKATVDWSGKTVIIPVHVRRNLATGFAADGGALPASATDFEGYEKLTVTAKFLYGRFRITGPAIASAKAGANSFIGYVDAEMNKLAEDVKTKANQASIFGGEVVGYVWEKQNAATFQYSGRQIAQGLSVGVGNNAQLVRLDTYATVGAATQVNAITSDSIIFNAAINTAAVPAGVPMAVVAVVGLVTSGASTEFSGITTNLGSASHFGVDRTSATGTATELQSNHITVSNGGVPVVLDAYQSLNLDRLQAGLDLILQRSSEAPELLLMSPVMRQEYTSLLVGTAASNLMVEAGSKSKTGDGGFTGLSFGGIPIRTSKDCFAGTIFFISPKSWKLTELEKPGFADLDGNILARSFGGGAMTDSYEGFYRIYSNIVCTRPNANLVLTGVDF
jgi:hypothetical protein